MACEPIYSRLQWALIQIGAFFALCRYRTSDGVAWEPDGAFSLRRWQWLGSILWVTGIGGLFYVLL